MVALILLRKPVTVKENEEEIEASKRKEYVIVIFSKMDFRSNKNNSIAN